jgi:hypothetical protein
MADRPGTAGQTALPAVLVAVGAGVWVLRQDSLRWGATSGEAPAALPGDDLVPVPDCSPCRRVTRPQLQRAAAYLVRVWAARPMPHGVVTQ